MSITNEYPGKNAAIIFGNYIHYIQKIFKKSNYAYFLFMCDLCVYALKVKSLPNNLFHIFIY